MASGDASDEQVSFLVRHLRQEGRESGAHSLRSEALCILENMSDSQFGSLLNGLAVKPEIVSFIAAILYGCDMSTHPEQVSNRRVKCFEVSVCVLKGGCLNQQGARDLVELLGMHARQLHCEQTLSLIDAALDGSHIGGAGSLTQMLDLLPGLVGGSSDCREYCVEKLYEMAWPCDLVIAYTAALVGLCTSDVECERAMTKIMSYLVHLPGNGKGMEPATAPIHNIDPEELPVLVYHLTSISKKCASSPSLLASLVEVVAESLDAMLTAAQGNEKEHGRRMRPVLATIIHHLATMLTKDQGVADELLNLVKTRCMFTNHSLCYQRTGAPLLSSAKLLLALLASKTPRNEIKTLTALTEFVQEIYALQLIGSTSIWFQPTIWSKVISIYPSHLCDVFDVLLSKCSSMQLEAVSAPLVNLAFLLVSTQASFSPNDFGALGAVAGIIGSEGTIKSGARDVLLQNSIQVAPPHSSSSNTVCNQVPGSPGAFGAWLLSNIFIYNEHARTQIARELVVRLLVHAQVSLLPLSSKPISVKKSLNPRGQVEVSNMHPPSAVTSNPTGHSKVDQEIALLCVSILEKLAVLCPEGLIAVGVDLQESFMALPELAGPTASRLVTVLGGLFGVCHGLSDRCAISRE